ncbi:hypothetical protein Cni_G18364 [Canna indica]|uniref:Uncharacterized protein n=1 Tax=Canna indica TaxID=4628 RepID=A0AAQ3KPH2_9LILI|nr:hypothetical protein Cni_G18364 [Canna indica]
MLSFFPPPRMTLCIILLHLAPTNLNANLSHALLYIYTNTKRVLVYPSARFKFMAFAVASLLVFFFLLLELMPFGADAAQRRAVELQSRTSPHGLAFENPMPFPPSAFEFFHPDVLLPPAASPIPLTSFYPAATSAKVRADEEEEESAAGVLRAGRGRGVIGARGVAAVAIGLALVVLAAMVVSYVVVKRRRRADSGRGEAIVQPADA